MVRRKEVCLVLDVKLGDIFDSQMFRLNFVTLQLQRWCYVASFFSKNIDIFLNLLSLD